TIKNKAKENLRKRKLYVIHYRGNPNHSVAARSGDQFHHGRAHPSLVGGSSGHDPVQFLCRTQGGMKGSSGWGRPPDTDWSRPSRTVTTSRARRRQNWGDGLGAVA